MPQHSHLAAVGGAKRVAAQRITTGTTAEYICHALITYLFNFINHPCLQNCKAKDSDHRTADCPNARAAGGPPAAVALPVPVVGGGAAAAPASAAAASGLVLFGPPNEMTLFHQTSPAFGQKIIQEQRFLCSDPSKGKPLLAGPGIYFAASAVDTNHKVRNPANKGCILAATVSLGKVLAIGFDGDKSITLETLRARGFDSVSIPRNGNPGTEYVVYDYRQVTNIRVHK